MTDVTRKQQMCFFANIDCHSLVCIVKLFNNVFSSIARCHLGKAMTHPIIFLAAFYFYIHSFPEPNMPQY